MGPGSAALLALINRYLEWDEGDRLQEGSQPPGEPRVDLSVDTTQAIRRWNLEPAYRADLTEAWLANGYVYPEPEDNRIVSPTTGRAAEDQVLRDRAYRSWLAGSRLAPSQIRWRRVCAPGCISTRAS